MATISCFTSPKRLPGSKKVFPNVSARINSFKERHTESSADGESRAKLIDQPKQRTHHDSSGVAGCLKGPILEPKPKMPVRKPIVTCRKAAPVTAAPEWNITTRVDYKAEVKLLPGTKKTLADFVRKPFRAAPVPPSTYKQPKDLAAGKQSAQHVAKKDTAKKAAEVVPPFRAKPVPASTYKPFQPVVAKTRQPVNDIKKSDVESAVLVEDPQVAK